MSRAQMKYHPTIGYTYMPSAKLRVPGAQGGGYLVRTNAAGFRSDREFVEARTPGKVRALLFGDSQTAGDGGVNADRYGDRLERLVPGLEVYNYGLSGSGPDQHLLVYQQCAHVEHDLLVIALYVENIRRVTRSVVKSRDADGQEAYYPKPYYRVEGGELVLHNVPVPKQPWTEQTLPEELRSQVYSYLETNFFARKDRPALRKVASLVPLRNTIKQVAMRLSGFQPLPDYDDPTSPQWILLRRILEAWLAASKAPVLLVTIPHYAYFVSSSDPSGYQARFRELARDTGCQIYDPLAGLMALSAKERASLWSDASGHLSSQGHAVLARLLAPVLERHVQAGLRAAAAGTG
jgi:lysophospholipase L1-like esterase